MTGSRKRVVVTGIGAITPIGLNAEEFWKGLVAGKSGIDYISSFDATGYPVRVAAEVKGFDPTQYMDIKRADRTERATQFAIAATRMALESAKLDMEQEISQRVGVIIATSGMAPLLIDYADSFRKRGPKRIDPLLINKIAPSMVASQVGLEFKARGPNTSLSSACASGSDAIGSALNHLRLGHVDVMLAGGSETTIHPIVIACTGRVGALSPESDPEKACRPFDLERNGFVYGEGTAMLVLETLEHALERSAPILAELAGAGWSFDAYNDTAPDPMQQFIAIKNAIEDAEMMPGQIDYVNAHGTSTKLNDAAETLALKLIMNDHAYAIPVSSNKSMIGHLACAAGAVEAAASVMTLKEGIIPPTINYETPDPACDLDYVPNKAREKAIKTCLSNSFGLGGQNCCLVFKKYE